jgi:hypothetical protein
MCESLWRNFLQGLRNKHKKPQAVTVLTDILPSGTDSSYTDELNRSVVDRCDKDGNFQHGINFHISILRVIKLKRIIRLRSNILDKIILLRYTLT